MARCQIGNEGQCEQEKWHLSYCCQQILLCPNDKHPLPWVGLLSRTTPRLDYDTGEPSLVDAVRREGALQARSRHRAEEQGMETEKSRAALSQLQREGCCPMGPDPGSS